MAMRFDGGGKKGGSKPKPPAPPATPVVGYPKGYTEGPGYPKAPAATPVVADPGKTWPATPGVARPANNYPSTGASNGVGVNATGSAAPLAAPAASPQMSQDEFLAQDAEFNDTRSSLQREYEDLLANIARQRSDYELDTNNSLRNMGWSDNGWNQNDKMTAYGQAYQDQLGDFASRGLLDSSMYGGALNDLNRGFNQQRTDLQSALQRFITGQSEDQGRAKSALESNIAAAQRQAMARYAAGLGL